MAKKFYVVKKGKTPGIYNSWDECKAQVEGFSCAVYKSFLSEQEARAFLGDLSNKLESNEKKEEYKVTEHKDADMGEDATSIDIYVDGSYNSSTNEFSYGMVILSNGQEYKYSEKFHDTELATMRNVAGEIKGAEAAMRYAVENAIPSIHIYHDYEGIAKWCLGEWKTNKEGTKAYKNYYESIKDKVSILFIKVTGHSNDKYNDMADELAKHALGIE